MRFYQACLKCGKLVSANNYTCTCGAEPWTKEYRILDVKCQLLEKERKAAVAAFKDFDLDHQKGILQYFFTPHSEFTDCVKLKVGLTSFFELPQLGAAFDARVFIKNEGDNPSGCFKDRETLMAALHSLAEGKRQIVIYSSGNAAASAALFADRLGLKLITCVAGDTYPEKIDYIQQRGAAVIRIGTKKTSFEEGYRLFAQLNEECFFVGKGFDNWSVRNPYRVIGDKTTAIEIVKQFRSQTGHMTGVPDYVVVSTGNGSCLAGIWRGFKELLNLGVIDRTPRMVSAAIKNASPVFKAYQKKLTGRPAVCTLEGVPEEDKEIGSIILAEEGYDSMEATKALFESGGLAVEVRKSGMRRALIDLLEKDQRTAIERRLLPEPASLVTLAAIKKMRQSNILHKSSTAVALISGHGAKARQLLMKMLRLRPRLQKVMQNIIDEYELDSNFPVASKKGQLVTVGLDLKKLRDAFTALSIP